MIGANRYLNALLRRLLIPSRMRRSFTRIHEEAGFGPSDSSSGPGSDLRRTERVREALPAIIAEFGVKSMLDAPCGDFFWLRHVPLPGVRYIGADIVRSLVRSNKKRFADSCREFLFLDLTRDPLPKVDLVLCRDCLVHLPFDDGLRVIRNFKNSGSNYVLATTFPGIPANEDLPRIGGWRPLDLQQAPYRFPTPVRLINEQYFDEGGRYANKSLGLWDLRDIQASG